MLNTLRSLFRERGLSASAAEAARSPAPSAQAGYRPARVRLFIKPYCPWCRQAMDWLDDHSVPHTVLDVISDRRAYDEMFRLSGQTLAPVIDVDGQVLADFWRKLERGPTLSSR